MVVAMFAIILLSNLCFSIEADNNVHVGAIVDFDSLVGKVAKTAIDLAVEDVNNDPKLLNGMRLLLHMRDGQRDSLRGARAAVNLLKGEAVAIIGPQTSQVAEFVSDVGDAANVPIVSFSATSPLLSNSRFPYFVRMAHSDALQMKAIAALVRLYGWRRIVVVYPDNDFGFGAVNSLNDALTDVGSEIEYRSSISPKATTEAIREELYKLNNMQSRVFVAHMNADLGLKLFAQAHEIGMMGSGYVWITTDGFASLLGTLLNDSTMASMEGIVGVKTYVPNSKKLKDFSKRWKERFRAENLDEDFALTELNQYGLLAYDSVQMVARAVVKLTSSNTRFNFLEPSSPPVALGNATDLSTIRVFQQGQQLLQNILATNLTGLSGAIRLSNGELSGSTYQIVNVVGKSYRVVGYWTDETQDLSRAFPLPPYNSVGSLKAVVWPGGDAQIPRGWEIPTMGKRLRIGVPVKNGLQEFVTVTFDKSRNQSIVTGFCKDVFDAVLRRLDYALPYDLIPYDTDNYDNLVYQVYLNKFDAVLGDTTILANRSKFVDFTHPFTETGMVMMVPITTGGGNNPWAFLLPFTPDLWCATGAFFIFTGVVVWLLERRINPDFSGDAITQVITSLWFSFSTLFFSHREKIKRNSSRIVIIIWLFVVLILTSNYTANLTSILTVKQMTPTITSVVSVRDEGVKVGYQKGSFVEEYLEQLFGISKKKMKFYSTPEEYGEALTKGQNNGGVAAIFDEIPYVRLFLSQQCGYTIVGPTYRTGGLGFVFPKGSPLLSDISRAVLSVSEDKEMQKIEKMYFNDTLCASPGAVVDSNRSSSTAPSGNSVTVSPSAVPTNGVSP
ncbi:glutamate receptor 2.7-like [Cryptomeria japonica]|uniref:glutamate receptor 2.7-like n=1 Tax=Cryptomeria japonica TaxID=3369 RepID=UPI0027DA714B|nr:glutamate receptor 2.7-like [Cryptomeria japonica]